MSTAMIHDLPRGTEPLASHQISGGGGVRLNVREWGNRAGAPIVFVHGWSQSQLCWSRQVGGRLAESFKIVTFDNRGHGMSEKPRDADAYREERLWAEDLAAVVDGLGLERPVLVGWSYGGFILTDYLRAFGDDGVAGIVLVGGAVRLSPPTFEHIGPDFLGNAPDASSADLATSIAAVRRFLTACTRTPLSNDDWSLALAWNMVVPPEVRGAMISREIDGDDVLSAAGVPVRVAHGRSDTIVLPSMAEHVLRVCPTAEATWYDGVGHMPFWESPDRFDRELAEFVVTSR